MISTLNLLLSISLAPELPLHTLVLPPGYQIEAVAEAPNVRQLALAKDGTLFGGSRSEGKLYGFIDEDKDGIYEHTVVLAEGLNMPSGVAIKDNALYVAEVSRILKFDAVLPLNNNTKPTAITYYSGLPNKRHHGWKYLKFSPTGDLYFNIGAPCNICISNPPFASIVKLTEKKEMKVVAHGVRNSVGFSWHPKSHQLWFTENGRDYLGDDSPSDELNTLTHEGQHFGFPFIHATGINDPQFGTHPLKKDRITYTPPAYQLGAHVAPLGMTFLKQALDKHDEDNEEKSDQQTLLIAEHGSWNRSKKVGYRVVKLSISEDKVINHEVFISGWLTDQKHWGRPTDIIEDVDGSLLISDDHAGVIYRVKKQ